MLKSMDASESSSPSSRKSGAVFGLSRLIVALGVFSAAVFSLTLFVVATVQAYFSITHALTTLGEGSAAKHLMIAAVEQTDLLLVALALLIISTGMYSLFVSPTQVLPSPLRVYSFDDLKQKLIGIVVVAMGVNFFSVALEWKGGSDLLVYGLALAVVILAVSGYSVILAKYIGHHGAPEDE